MIGFSRVLSLAKRYSTLWLLLSCGLLAGVLVGIRYRMEVFLARDSYVYLEVASNWRSMPWNEAVRAYPSVYTFPPGIFYLLCAAEELRLPPLAVGIGLNILLAASLPFAFYWMSLLIFRDRRIALMSAFLISISPLHIRLFCSILRDPPYWTSMVWGCAFGIAATELRKPYLWGVCGIFCALAILFRKEGIEMVFPTVLFLASSWIFYSDRKQAVKDNALGLAMFLLTLILITYPIQMAMKRAGSMWQVIPYQYVIEVFKRF